MADIDFDELSDEDFMKLSEEEANNPTSEKEEVGEVVEPNEENDPQENSEEVGEVETQDEPVESEVEEVPTEEVIDELETEDPQKSEDKSVEAVSSEIDQQSNADPEEKTPDPKDQKSVKKEEKAEKSEAQVFFEKVTAPFKANGQQMNVRTPEEVIRLMQFGVNYNKRMEELKPARHLQRMLGDHGLTDPEQLSLLIDIHKGDKNAILKLLKEKNIDPLDLDTTSEPSYKQNNYIGSTQENSFRDSLENAISSPDGKALLTEINESWDGASKDRLSEDPNILNNLVELKQAGIYDKVKAELDYQQSLGYLTGIPFLQAFDAVGEAMKKAGVFNQQPDPTPQMGQLQSNTNNGQLPSNPQPVRQPVARGSRKVEEMETPSPNPHLSSTPPSKQAVNPTPAQMDFDKMSDEDFLKMMPPS